MTMMTMAVTMMMTVAVTMMMAMVVTMKMKMKMKTMMVMMMMMDHGCSFPQRRTDVTRAAFGHSTRKKN